MQMHNLPDMLGLCNAVALTKNVGWVCCKKKVKGGHVLEKELVCMCRKSSR